MPLDGTWTILDEYMDLGDYFSGPWTWNVAYPVRFTITDLYVVTDRYEVYDNGVLVMTTAFQPDWDVLGLSSPFTSPPYETDPGLAFASDYFSKGTYVFGPGAHSLEIRCIHKPLTASGDVFPDSTVAFKAEADIGYVVALDLLSGGDLIRFSTGDPSVETVINGTTGASVTPYAMDFDNTATTLLAIDGNNGALGIIDPSSGIWSSHATITGLTGLVTGMSVDPTDGTVYVSSSDYSYMYLYTLDAGTGVLSLVGSADTYPACIDIAIDQCGTMYGHDIGSDALYQIDKTDASTRYIGQTGLDATYAQGMDFDYSTNTLYATYTHSTIANDFVVFDLTTGAATVIPGFRAGEFEMAVQVPAPGLAGIGTAYCFGDPGNIPCSCNNSNDGMVPCSGCRNGVHGSGAQLLAFGTASVSNDTVSLWGSRSEPNNFGLFFQADNMLTGAPYMGDGLRCAGGNLKRLQTRISDDVGDAHTSVVITLKAGNITAGDTKNYQWWYRNPAGSPCGTDQNTSNGYSIYWGP